MPKVDDANVVLAGGGVILEGSDHNAAGLTHGTRPETKAQLLTHPKYIVVKAFLLQQRKLARVSEVPRSIILHY